MAEFRTEFLLFRDEIRDAFSAVASRTELYEVRDAILAQTRSELRDVRDTLMAQTLTLHEDLVETIKRIREH